MEEIPCRFRYSSIFSSSIESTGMLLHSFWNSEMTNRFYIPVSKPWAKTPQEGKGRDLISNTPTFWHVSLSPPAGTHSAQPSPSPNADALPKTPKTRKDETPTNKTTTKHPQAKLHLSFRSVRRQPVLFVFIFYGVSFCLWSPELCRLWMSFIRSQRRAITNQKWQLHLHILSCHWLGRLVVPSPNLLRVRDIDFRGSEPVYHCNTIHTVLYR